MLNDEKDLLKCINELTDCLERALEKEVDIEIINGDLKITITNKNKQVKSIQNPDDVKLSLDDDLYDLHQFVSSLPEEI